jgi:hypothetical protein
MRFRAGLVIGFAGGFYLGTMAGRERYQQINRMIRRAKRSNTLDVAGDKAKAMVDLGVERARDIVDNRFNRESGSADLAHTPGNGDRPR